MALGLSWVNLAKADCVSVRVALSTDNMAWCEGALGCTHSVELVHRCLSHVKSVLWWVNYLSNVHAGVDVDFDLPMWVIKIVQRSDSLYRLIHSPLGNHIKHACNPSSAISFNQSLKWHICYTDEMAALLHAHVVAGGTNSSMEYFELKCLASFDEINIKLIQWDGKIVWLEVPCWVATILDLVCLYELPLFFGLHVWFHIHIAAWHLCIADWILQTHTIINLKTENNFLCCFNLSLIIKDSFIS